MNGMTSKVWFLPKEPHTKRVLFHTINHSGLGHLNRAIAVTQWLKAENNDLQVLFLIEGGEHFIEPTGFPWILIPSQPSESEQCEYIVQRVLDVFRPDLIIHETVLHEYIHRPIRAAGVKEALMGNVGGLLRGQLRDKLAIMNELDLLIVLQRREEVEPSDQALIAQYTGKTVYAGPLVRLKDSVAGDDLRRRLNLTNANKVILLTFGGGGYNMTGELLANMLAARTRILDEYPLARLVLITGPYFTGELPEVDDFVAYASRFEPFLTDYINIASAVVSMAGYSTLNEIASSGIPAVCVPVSEADDQVGAGNLEEYARGFPNIRISSSNIEELTQQVIAALARARDLTIVQEFWRRAEMASQSIVSEIKDLLTDTI
jgi:predicted glycosyltransferase